MATNHEKQYINKHYNSFYEDGSDFSQDLVNHLSNLATLFARVVYKLVMEDDNLKPEFKSNKTLVEEMLTCFLKNSNCALFKTVQDKKSMQNLCKISLKN